MLSPTHVARWTGGAYLALAVFGVVGILVIRPQLLVEDDAAATLANLTTHARLAHRGSLLELLIVLAQAAAALGFYVLMRPDRPGAAFAVASFGLANAAAILGSAAMVLTASAVAEDPTLSPGGDAGATVLLLFAVADSFWAVGALFFGLWLIPMGWFALSTRRMPRVLGWVLTAGGAGYVLSALLDAGVPQVSSVVVDGLTVIASIGEFWMIGYLLVRGIRPSVDRQAERDSTPAEASHA